ncbi:GNAT family N-acetyltransferase [Paremcibacter congregatus]|uniref:GNAT family N-acetyltransferase n=1 Tax=Paremcibacter congregatus TaxID=2043170 RepID=UPI003A940145
MMQEKILTIRSAMPEDTGLVLSFIKDLADYEKLLHEVTATEDDLRQSLFGNHPVAHVVIGEISGIPQGFALYFYNYSTFRGRPGIYLEDLFVSPDARGSGLGKALILHLAKKAYAEGCGRMEWSVLDWNTPSIDFYDSLGAMPQDEWIGYRLDRAGLKKLSD